MNHQTILDCESKGLVGTCEDKDDFDERVVEVNHFKEEMQK